MDSFNSLEVNEYKTVTKKPDDEIKRYDISETLSEYDRTMLFVINGNNIQKTSVIVLLGITQHDGHHNNTKL